MVINDKKLGIVEHYTHIGIERSPMAHLYLSLAIDEAIKAARKTAYSLMGAGFLGLNGIYPYVGLKLRNLYIKPRLLCGLECLTLRKQDIQRLCQYQKKILKFFMHLPERTADPAIYILSGELPIEADLGKKYLTQLMNILSLEVMG